jgi:hypothetical protein
MSNNNDLSANEQLDTFANTLKSESWENWICTAEAWDNHETYADIKYTVGMQG